MTEYEKLINLCKNTGKTLTSVEKENMKDECKKRYIKELESDLKFYINKVDELDEEKLKKILEENI